MLGDEGCLVEERFDHDLDGAAEKSTAYRYEEGRLRSTTHALGSNGTPKRRSLSCDPSGGLSEGTLGRSADGTPDQNGHYSYEEGGVLIRGSPDRRECATLT